MKHITIEPCEGTYAAYEHDEYPQYSVLAGSPRRTFLEFGELDELKKEYPDAQICEGSTRVDIQLPDCPPDWFDPTIAGEEW